MPSRAALMTGRYSRRSGLGTIIIGGTPNTLQSSEVTFGKLFKSQGYHTGIVGKWHLGASEVSWPMRQGFDEYHVGVIETTDGTLVSRLDDARRVARTGYRCGRARHLGSDATGKLTKVRPYTVDYRRQVEGDIAKASVDYITRQAKEKEPFLLYVGFTHTHYPPAFLSPAINRCRSSAIPSDKTSLICRSIAAGRTYSVPSHFIFVRDRAMLILCS